MRLTILLILYLLPAFLTGSIALSSAMDRGVGEESTEISAEEFLGLDTREEVIILDVRTPAEYDEGHLENAVLINIRSHEAYDKIDRLNKNKTYYVYCRSGKRSSRAVDYMRENGFERSFNITGGLIELRKEEVDLVR